MIIVEILWVIGILAGCGALLYLGLKYMPTMTRDDYYNRKKRL